jgi:hypothetical protein
MTNTRLYHERPASKSRGGVPWWWFGAPFIAVAYVFATPRFLPDRVSTSPEMSGALPALRWLVGVVVGVALLSAVRAMGWILRRTVSRR